MANNIPLGQKGEQIVSNYLISRGWLIVINNYRRNFGEIDLIAKAPDQTLVFIEVKTFLGEKVDLTRSLIPEDNLTYSKLKKLQRICQFFVNRYPDLINEEAGWRIDLVAVEIFERKPNKLRHYKNI